MLRFFRNIRQKLIEQENVRKYIWYALGEILLVMIGILLALQVNNWNEKRKETNLSHSILGQMEEKIAADTTTLNFQIDKFESMMRGASWVVNQFENDVPYHPEMDTALAKISTFGVIEADYTAFNYLENVGIGIINNKDLREKISEYYDISEFIFDVDEHFELNKYFRQEVYPKYFKRYRYGSYVVPVDFEALKRSNEFRVVLDMCLNDAMYYYQMSKLQKERALELLKMIGEELSN